MVKKMATWGSLAFLIFFVAYRPAAAANVVKSIAGGLGDVGSGFASFVSNLVA